MAQLGCLLILAGLLLPIGAFCGLAVLVTLEESTGIPVLGWYSCSSW